MINKFVLTFRSRIIDSGKSSGLTKQLKTYKMLLTVDETVFTPREPKQGPLHSIIKVSLEKQLKHPRKGMIYLINALKKLSSIKDSYRSYDIILLIKRKIKKYRYLDLLILFAK